MMSRENGRELETELDHIRQSVQDILTTPLAQESCVENMVL